MTDVTYLAKARQSRDTTGTATASWTDTLREFVPGIDVIPALASAAVMILCLTQLF
ncbi:hypothetical protein [Rhodospirillum centenum]|nr:hypothetical protein [Rhodospirillum centenum]